MDMDMENQERAMLEAESEEEETLEAEVTEGALSISRVGRNFLTDRELLEAESLHMIDPSGYTSAEADVREAIFRERLVRKQQQRNTSRSRALRQLAELDEREMEIESMGAEMLAAGEWDAELDADDDPNQLHEPSRRLQQRSHQQR